eukprot:2090176-Rhodomonas_salina.2
MHSISQYRTSHTNPSSVPHITPRLAHNPAAHSLAHYCTWLVTGGSATIALASSFSGLYRVSPAPKSAATPRNHAPKSEIALRNCKQKPTISGQSVPERQCRCVACLKSWDVCGNVLMHVGHVMRRQRVGAHVRRVTCGSGTRTHMPEHMVDAAHVQQRGRVARCAVARGNMRCVWEVRCVTARDGTCELVVWRIERLHCGKEWKGTGTADV